VGDEGRSGRALGRGILPLPRSSALIRLRHPGSAGRGRRSPALRHPPGGACSTSRPPRVAPSSSSCLLFAPVFRPA